MRKTKQYCSFDKPGHVQTFKNRLNAKSHAGKILASWSSYNGFSDGLFCYIIDYWHSRTMMCNCSLHKRVIKSHVNGNLSEQDKTSKTFCHLTFLQLLAYFSTINQYKLIKPIPNLKNKKTFFNIQFGTSILLMYFNNCIVCFYFFYF